MTNWDNNPRVIDNDKGEITVSIEETELRSWSYESEDERRTKMLLAREYVEGWCDSRDVITDGANKARNELIG